MDEMDGWILRVLHNMRNEAKLEGPLKTIEIETAANLWIKRAQMDVVNTDLFEKHSGQFNLQKTCHGIYVCKGRLQGEYPIYLPASSTFTQKLVENAHYHTLHGGVGLTMTKVRERYWIPTLRQLVKKMIQSCHGCKRFTTQHLSSPPVGPLPVERTVGTRPFEVIGIDYAGPIMYKKTPNTTGKAYILLFSCSLTRAICLELLANQTIETFLPALKRFIARRGRPRKIFSDNFSTFVAAAKWLKKAVRSELLHDYLACNEVKWQFNLSRAPWWGGQFERMVGLVKQALYKAIGAATLAWEELAEVLTDVEMTLNNRPLTYVEDDVQMPILTPNVMLFGQPNWTPEGELSSYGDQDLKKRARHIKECKQRIWMRWTREYLRGLRERHDLRHKGRTNNISIGDVMLIRGDERNRGHWKVGIVRQLITGRDGIVRGAKLRVGGTIYERAVQHLYPLELHCDDVPDIGGTLNPTAEEFRPRRNASAIADILLKDQIEEENSEPLVE